MPFGNASLPGLMLEVAFGKRHVFMRRLPGLRQDGRDEAMLSARRSTPFSAQQGSACAEGQDIVLLLSVARCEGLVAREPTCRPR